MATYSKHIISGSTAGAPIAISASAATTANALHVCGTGTTTIDEVYIQVFNTSTTDYLLTVQIGGTTTNEQLPYTVPGQGGPYQILAGHCIHSAATISAFGTAGNLAMKAIGYVNRIST